MRRRTTLIGSMLVKKGDADGMICGTISTTHRHLHFIDQVIGKREGCSVYAAMNALVLPGRQIFLVDTHVNVDPTPEQLAEITIMAAEEVRRFGIEPKVALLSHSNFGTSNAPSAQKMRDVLEILQRARAGPSGGRRNARRRRTRRTTCAAKCCPTRRSKATRTCWCCRTSMRRTSRTACSRRPQATTSRSVRCCWVRPSRCMC